MVAESFNKVTYVYESPLVPEVTTEWSYRTTLEQTQNYWPSTYTYTESSAISKIAAYVAEQAAADPKVCSHGYVGLSQWSNASPLLVDEGWTKTVGSYKASWQSAQV